MERNSLHNTYKQGWADGENAPKLRTYVRYNEEYIVYPYVYIIYNKVHRTSLVQFHLILQNALKHFWRIQIMHALSCDEIYIEIEKHFCFIVIYIIR